MESRNILLIVICICAFLVLIFGIGFVWSMPDRERERPKEEENGNGREDVFQHWIDGNELPGLEPTEVPADKMPIVYGEKEDDTETAADKGDKDKTESESEKDVTDGSKKEKEKETTLIPVPKDDKPQYPTTWIVKPQPTPAPTVTTAPRRLQRVTEYWIQAGSFQSRSRAEALNEKLKEHGFQGQVKTMEVNKITHYRVRIGPYPNKKEAEKFLEWLKVLDGMGDSYISEVFTDKWVN